MSMSIVHALCPNSCVHVHTCPCLCPCQCLVFSPCPVFMSMCVTMSIFRFLISFFAQGRYENKNINQLQLFYNCLFQRKPTRCLKLSQELNKMLDVPKMCHLNLPNYPYMYFQSRFLSSEWFQHSISAIIKESSYKDTDNFFSQIVFG